jgi:hypothetical protein
VYAGTGLDKVEGRKSLSLLGSKPGPSAVQPLASRYRDQAKLIPYVS